MRSSAPRHQAHATFNRTGYAGENSPHAATDARGGLAQGRAASDNGFFRVRRDRTTPAARDYSRAMAADGDMGSSTSEAASRLGKRLASLGPTRSNLIISEGLIYAPEYGPVAVTDARGGLAQGYRL